MEIGSQSGYNPPMKISSKIPPILLAGMFLLAPFQSAFAGELLCGNTKVGPSITRGEVVSKVVKGLDLARKNQVYLSSCDAHLEDCFFVFSTMSRFDNISFKPLILYPDVSPAYAYYEDINTASKLGIIHGYVAKKNSPFRPRQAMQRMDALKVILEAAQVVQWKDRFELVTQLGGEQALKRQETVFKDVDARQDDMWWYPRYLTAAIKAGIISPANYFRPHDLISQEEFYTMLNLAQNYNGPKILTRRDSK